MLILFRLIHESFRFAIVSLMVNKVRTVLSLLGITIGIFSIIALFSVFDSMEKAIRDSISSLGNNVLYIQKWPWMAGGSDYPWWKYWQRPEATLTEMAELEKRSNAAEAFAFWVSTSRDVSYQSATVSGVSIQAVSHGYPQVMPFDLQNGRYFTPIESQTGRNIIIIGADVASELFGSSDPTGQTVKVFGRKLNVIGVLKKEGENMFGEANDKLAFIPINFARNVMDIKTRGTIIAVKNKEGLPNEELKDELIGLMRSIRKLKPLEEDNFSINEMDIINKSFDQLFGVIAIVGWIVGGFSLLVGGFGIANIMFVSVKERTNQIGIQKSIGAKNYFILLQFLFEAVFLSIIGGIVGLILVWLISVLVTNLSSFTLLLSFKNILLGLLVSGSIGLISGFIPSWSAAHLDPVDAMRSSF
ncbi:MAG: ABC transporter permease [Bacteroidales bacterium]|nr:ABC transporter permease [Bacteroidales bacterium]